MNNRTTNRPFFATPLPGQATRASSYDKYSTVSRVPRQEGRGAGGGGYVGPLGPLLPPLAEQPRDALDAALSLAAERISVLPMYPEGTYLRNEDGELVDRSKSPALPQWQFAATIDPAVIQRWWRPGGRYHGFGVGVAMRMSKLMAVDTDTAAAAEGVAELAGGDLGAGLVVVSKKGIKGFYRRPARLASHNGNKASREALGGADVIMGAVLAWSPGRQWYGDPGAIGDAPGWLLEALDSIYTERPPQAPLPPRPTLPRGDGDGDRLAAYVLRAIIDEAAAVAGLGDGRKTALHVLGVKLGALVTGLAPQLERDAGQAAERACAACGLALRIGLAHFANGWRYGAANPRPVPPARELGLGALPPQERATLEARLADATADVMAQAKGIGCRAQQAETARSVVGALAELLRERGSDTAIIGVESLAALAKRGAGSVHRVVGVLEGLGWTVHRGGIGADDRPMATRWTLPKGGSGGAFGHPGRDAVTTCGVSCPAPFRDDQKVSPTAYGLGSRVGPTMRRIAVAMADGLPKTADQVAEAARTTPKTAARCLDRMAEAKLATVETVPTAGRAARCWALAADVLRDLAGDAAEVASEALQAVRDLAARFEARAIARIEEGRRTMAAARDYARRIGASVAAVLKVWRDGERRRAMAERDALRELAGSGPVAAAHRAEARAQLRDGAARRDWAQVTAHRDLVADLGMVTTW